MNYISLDENESFLIKNFSLNDMSKFQLLINSEFYKKLFNGTLSEERFEYFIIYDMNFLLQKALFIMNFVQRNILTLDYKETNTVLRLASIILEKRNLIIQDCEKFFNKKSIQNPEIEKYFTKMIKMVSKNINLFDNVVYSSTLIFYFIVKHNTKYYKKDSKYDCFLLHLMSDDYLEISQQAIHLINNSYKISKNKKEIMDILNLTIKFDLDFIRYE